MLKPNINTFDASKFSWKGKEGVADASDLGLKAGMLPYCPLYDDACDLGLKLVNPNNGNECYFVLTDVIRCQPNIDSIAYWQFGSFDRTIKLTIFND
jgi:hypothetical protein